MNQYTMVVVVVVNDKIFSIAELIPKKEKGLGFFTAPGYL
jgi:hypothetical protein